MYYAAVNAYSSETSVGFANTWGVIGFATKSARDEYVDGAKDRATRSITSKEVTKYGGKIGQVELFQPIDHKAVAEYWDSL
jgi:hypothetical protein